ncbi:MAG: 50S ribosomal protein L24 [Nitrososphaerota archaeon]|nr:50S ribosomal protein L24 [Nitrososphaerota archaeon]
MQKTVQTSKPSKQRKMLFQAPDHKRYKHFAAPLSPELRKSYGARSLPVRSGDLVRIMRGDRKGFEGKVSRVDRKKYRIYIEGLTREKVDGTTIFIPVHPSKVMITKLNLDDKWRRKILERRKKVEEAAEEIVEKTVEKPPEAPPLEEKPIEEKVAVTEPLPPEKEEPKRRRRASKKREGEKAEEDKQKKTRVKPGKRKSTEEAKLG